VVLPDPTTVTGVAGDRLSIPVPPDNFAGQSTHPSVVHLDAPVSGFAYWMAFTPYQGGDDEFEDPCIAASVDGITWVVPTGLVNPLDDQPGSPGAYNSDVDLRYVNNSFTLIWRTFNPAATGAEEKLYYSTSADGITWETKTQFYASDMTVRRLLSPAVLFEGGAWTMWAVDIVPSPNQVVRVQGGAALTDAWADPVGVDMGPMLPGKEPWHLNLIAVDGGYVGLLTDCTQDVSGLDGLLLFITSTDGLTWSNSGRTVIPQEQDGEHNALYRASLVPETVSGTAGWRVWYSAWITGSPSVWNMFRTWIGPPATEPETPTAPPPVTEAVIRDEVTWLGVDDQTGRVIAELPDMRGEVSRLLTAYDSSKLTYPLADAPGVPVRLLEQATEPRATSIIAVANDIPVWAGRVLQRAGGSDPNLTLACATTEVSLKNQQVGSQAFTAVDRATVAQQLVANSVIVGGAARIALEYDVTLTGDPIDRDYLASDLTNCYDALRALAAGGLLEWTIDLQWTSTARNQITRILRIAPRIGRVGTGMTPLFETGTTAGVSYTMDENFTTDRYANAVTVYGDGEGEDLPVSDTVYDEAALSLGTPIVHRAIHVRDVTEVHELTAIAQAELDNLKHGSVLWTLESRYAAYPRLGFDAGLGDDIDWRLTGPRHPEGVQGRGRMIGWSLNPAAGRWGPKLLDPHDQGV